ncbi:MAG: adenine phosphoribosyltransferase [Eubacteriales bacterium]
MDLKSKIRVIEGFPEDGISFKDITTVLQDPKLLKESIDQMTKKFENMDVDIVVGPESRGFIFGTPIAYKLDAGFVPVRKPGKLPAKVVEYRYDLEYGTDTLEIHEDAIKKGQRVLIIDDLLATGGTVSATAKLVEILGGKVVGLGFFIELTDLKGRDKLTKYNIDSIIKY